MHLEGKAIDFCLSSKASLWVSGYADALQRIGAIKAGGVGTYRTFVHLDTRGRRARWGFVGARK